MDRSRQSSQYYPNIVASLAKNKIKQTLNRVLFTFLYNQYEKTDQANRILITSEPWQSSYETDWTHVNHIINFKNNPPTILLNSVGDNIK